MPTYRYLHLDVFTSTPFEGNQLAVFPEPAGLDDALMQTIAREMNFSESTFVFPPSAGGDARVRIWTPAEELPMAGHPTIGTTFALASEGRIARGTGGIVLELGVGPTPVALDWNDRGLAFAWMTQRAPSFGATVADRERFAAALGIEAGELAADLPIQVVSCGVPFLMAPLASNAVVDAVQIDRLSLRRVLSDAGSPEVPMLVFAVDGGGAIYSRMLAPGLGITEDPATGGAAGPLGCYLLHYGVVAPEAARALLNRQGVAMKRPSRIHISVEGERGAIARVRVGGEAVVVGRGEIHV